MQYKKKPETFNTRVLNTVNTPCWLLEVSNYGEKKTSFNFYTRSESYAEAKMKMQSLDTMGKV